MCSCSLARKLSSALLLSIYYGTWNALQPTVYAPWLQLFLHQCFHWPLLVCQQVLKILKRVQQKTITTLNWLSKNNNSGHTARLLWAKFRSPLIFTISSSDIFWITTLTVYQAASCLPLLFPQQKGSSVRAACNLDGHPGLPWAHSPSCLQQTERCGLSEAAGTSPGLGTLPICTGIVPPALCLLAFISPQLYTASRDGLRTGCHHVLHTDAHTHIYTYTVCSPLTIRFLSMVLFKQTHARGAFLEL